MAPCPPFPVTLDRQDIRGCHRRSAADPHPPHWGMVPQVQRQGQFWLWVFEHTFRDHRFRPAKALLGRLEDQFDRPCQLLAVIIAASAPQSTRWLYDRHAHRRASHRGLRGIFSAGFLHNWQGIDIKTQQDHRSWLAPFQQRRPHPSWRSRCEPPCPRAFSSRATTPAVRTS